MGCRHTQSTSRATGRAIVSVTALLSLLFSMNVVAPTAHAEDEEEGKRRFVRGLQLYEAGRYLEAAEEFEAGYAAAPRPAFLLNIGHSYRRAGKLEDARLNYARLLEADPTYHKREEIEQAIREIDNELADIELARAEAQAAQQLPGPAEPQDYEYERRNVVTLEEREEEDDDSIFSSPWFWVGVGVVVAGGVAAGLLLTDSGSSCPGDVCITEMP